MERYMEHGMGSGWSAETQSLRMASVKGLYGSSGGVIQASYCCGRLNNMFSSITYAKEVESVIHVLFNCSYAKEVWLGSSFGDLITYAPDVQFALKLL